MALDSNPIKLPILLIIGLGAIVGFELGSVTLVGESLTATEGGFIFVIGLAVAFMMSQRSLGSMSNAELVAFLFPSLIVVAITFSQEAYDWAMGYNPWFGGAMFTMAGFAFWALTNENI